MRLKCLRSRFSRRIMIHIVPHCAMYTGSITRGISFTNVMAPVTWYSTCEQERGKKKEKKSARKKKRWVLGDLSVPPRNSFKVVLFKKEREPTTLL